MLGEKIRELREAKGLVQREIAAELDVDVAYVSKMETGEKPVSRNHLETFSRLFGVSEKELKTLWIADKLFVIARKEPLALKAMNMVQEEFALQSVNKK